MLFLKRDMLPTAEVDIGQRAPTKDQHRILQTANGLVSARRYGEAVRQFAQVADVYRESTTFVNEYSDALIATSTAENVNRALGLLNVSIQARQEKGTPLDERTAVLMARGCARGRHYDTALAWYRHAREINPGSEEVQFLAARDQAGDNFGNQGLIDGAVVLHRQGLQTREADPAGALTDFDKALVLFGGQGDPVVHAPWTVFERGETLRAMDLPNEAREDLSRARAHLDHPDVVAALHQLNQPS
jgi:tetratricopeptide (TPR) repeat protein